MGLFAGVVGQFEIPQALSVNFKLTHSPRGVESTCIARAAREARG